ncbi:protein of unassigned function [Methylobacterium oryzae CBMB20]|uniref:Protein of unassigned function n=1 Tax=Methylobacterium oryzae CBMB20 TaxID=693986 RepID=A0A089Q388_9HYPH|nr:protein of unassigned function [Methylobacterium oryzae CBMB20]
MFRPDRDASGDLAWISRLRAAGRGWTVLPIRTFLAAEGIFSTEMT